MEETRKKINQVETEISHLNVSWYKQPSFWISIFVVFLAVPGVVLSLLEIDNLRKKNKTMNQKMDHINQIVEEQESALSTLQDLNRIQKDRIRELGFALEGLNELNSSHKEKIKEIEDSLEYLKVVEAYARNIQEDSLEYLKVVEAHARNIQEEEKRLTSKCKELIDTLNTKNKYLMELKSFAPDKSSQAIKTFEESLSEEGTYKMTELGDSFKKLESALELAKQRNSAFILWHNWSLELGERRLGGVSGRYIGVNAEATCIQEKNGSIKGELSVSYWARSNNSFFGSKGVFRIRSPFLNRDLSISCQYKDEKQDRKKYDIKEKDLLNYKPSQLSISRDYD